MMSLSSLNPFQRTFFVRIKKPDEQYEEEYDDLNQCKHTGLFDRNGPRVEENNLDVEDQEDECKKVISHVELGPCLPLRGDTAFVGLALLWVGR